MLELSFDAGPFRRALLGPASRLRVTPFAIFVGDATEPAASRDGRYWRADGHAFTGGDCRGPLLARLAYADGATLREFGRFESARLTGSTLHGDTRLLAQLQLEPPGWVDVAGWDRGDVLVLEPGPG